MVLYAGRTVEAGSRASIAAAPWLPHAELLIGSVPELRQGWLEQVATSRERGVPAAVNEAATERRRHPLPAR